MFDLERDIFGGHFNFIFSRLTEDITNEGWQSHATPKEVCDMLIEKYNYKQTDKILVLFNTELIMSLYTKFSNEFIFSNVYFIADTMKKKNYIEKYLGKVNCKYLKEENWSLSKLIETIKEFNMKHFNVVFSNPPYNDSLDLNLINTLLENNITDEIIAVHPGIFLYNHNGDPITEKLRSDKKLKDVTLFWGNAMFNTNVKNTHCISIWDNKHNSEMITVHDKAFTERPELKEFFDGKDEFTYVTNVNEMTVHSAFSKKVWELYKKFINCDNVLNHITNVFSKNKTHFGFKYSIMQRGLDEKAPDQEKGGTLKNYGKMYACFGNGNKAITNCFIDENFTFTNFMMSNTGYTKFYPMWYFKTGAERENFFNYSKTKVVRFILSIIKFNAELNTTKFTRIIPWMGDYTRAWTDEDLIKKFDIDKELWNYIDKFIPDYYFDYRTTARGNI